MCYKYVPCTNLTYVLGIRFDFLNCLFCCVLYLLHLTCKWLFMSLFPEKNNCFHGLVGIEVKSFAESRRHLPLHEYRPKSNLILAIWWVDIEIHLKTLQRSIIKISLFRPSINRFLFSPFSFYFIIFLLQFLHYFLIVFYSFSFLFDSF